MAKANTKTVDQIEKVVGYRFKDADLLKRTLTHASHSDNRLGSNERLEFLGDAIFGYVICEYLFEHYPDLLEGELTKIKSTVVSRKSCAQVSTSIGLCSYLNLGKGMGGKGDLPSSISAAVFEAIVAGIYMDGGMEPARKFIVDHMKPLIEEAGESAHQQNYKSVLQQYAQQFLDHAPNYILLDEKGPDHSKCFEVCVELEGERYASAWANSKKEAEQDSALHCLIGRGLVEKDASGRVKLLGVLGE